MKHTIGITGALGYVGRRLVDTMLHRHYQLVGIVRPSADTSFLNQRGIEIRRANLGKPPLSKNVFEGIDSLIHLSGLGHLPIILGELKRVSIGHSIFVSSTGIFTKLKSPGSAIKRHSESLLAESGLNYVVLRPNMIYGSTRDKTFSKIMRFLRYCPVLPLPAQTDALQQPVHIDDVVSAIITAHERTQLSYRSFDLGGPTALPLRTVLKQVGSAIGIKPWFIPVPLSPPALAARYLRAYGIRTPVKEEQIRRLSESKAISIQEAKTALDFAPRDFKDGVIELAHELNLVK
jgi:uncharacterized protein YbjT (DUF2867 family)